MAEEPLNTGNDAAERFHRSMARHGIAPLPRGFDPLTDVLPIDQIDRIDLFLAGANPRD